MLKNRMNQYKSANFAIDGCFGKDRIVLTQTILSPAIYTGQIPATMEVLLARIPTIFDNECTNYHRHSFYNESKNTEIGHLLEHLILENMKLVKTLKCGKADYSGVTVWDWEKDKKGTYTITIYAKQSDRELFNKAFNKSVLVLEEIYSTQRAGIAPALLS